MEMRADIDDFLACNGNRTVQCLVKSKTNHTRVSEIEVATAQYELLVVKSPCCNLIGLKSRFLSQSTHFALFQRSTAKQVDPMTEITVES